MKWVLDWKCSLYSLTVCLDSMSPFPPPPTLFFFLNLFLLSFFSHILHQWYFPIPQDYWTKNNIHKSITFTSAVREPGTEEEENTVGGWGGTKQLQIIIFVDESHCFSGETTCSGRWETGSSARLPLGLNLYWRGAQQQHGNIFLVCFF